ncbi:unnamed protein product [Cercopithifilaria johnstoni]|uniref:C2H2-type domain-containing protein n=1 Tax=Cercopithifilaria johnstoni TaxID=2874296 RepID=A0A8J2LV53_9BILA|nr:unnamed protein product [Cercopithifilaria johnstoni]
MQEGIENEGRIETVANDSEASKKQYQCEVCGVLFGRSTTLWNHKIMHNDEKNYNCEICNKAFKWSGNLKNHKLTHGNVRPFKCHVCNKAFKRPHDLKKHNLTHGNERPYKCHMCSKTFKVSRNLKRHQLTHGNVQDGPYMVSTIRSKMNNVVVMAFGNDHISLLKFRNRGKSHGDKKCSVSKG